MSWKGEKFLMLSFIQFTQKGPFPESTQNSHVWVNSLLLALPKEVFVFAERSVILRGTNISKSYMLTCLSENNILFDIAAFQEISSLLKITW